MKKNKFLLVLISLLVLVSLIGCSAVDDFLKTATATPTTAMVKAAPTATVLPTPTATASLMATVMPTSAVPTATPTAEIVSTPARIADQKWPAGLFVSPVECEKSFNDASSWIICEPGVILDDSTAWTIPGTEDPWYANVPEGAFTYFSLGQGKITVDGYTIDLPYQKSHNYLVAIRGRIDDGIVDTDRNLTAEVTDFVPGHAIWAYMPTGAYISKDWFMQQLVASTTTNFTNCGALGCSRVTVVLLDVDTQFEQRFAVEADGLSTWTQIK